MRTKEEALKLFEYHAPDPDLDQDRIQRHKLTGDIFLAAADGLWETMPDGPGKTYALRKLQDARMAANACIANDGQ